MLSTPPRAQGSCSGPALQAVGERQTEQGRAETRKSCLSFALSVLLSGNCFVYLLSYPYSSLLRLSLEVMTILCRCENIETSEGVPLYVTGVAQVIIHQLPNTVSDCLSLCFEEQRQQQQQQQDNIKTNGFLMGQLILQYPPLLPLLQCLPWGALHSL